MGSVGHVVHSGVGRARIIEALFFMLGRDSTESTKSTLGHITPNMCFASGGTSGSHSAFRCVWGMKHLCTIFLARVELLRI
jgi:hypothetical protein